MNLNSNKRWAAIAGLVVAAVATAAIVESQTVTQLSSSRQQSAVSRIAYGGDCGAAIPGPNRLIGTLAIETQGGGPITGGGQGGLIEFFGAQHSVARPYLNGVPQGNPARGDLILTKTVDQSTPRLIQALVVGDLVTNATARFYDGAGTNDYTIVIENGFVTSVETRMVKRCDGSYSHLEDVGITYAQITYIHETGGVSYQDDIFGG